MTGGTFRLTFNGQTTEPIAYDASGSELQSALVLLRLLDQGDVFVTRATPGAPWIVTFVGRVGGRNQPDITATSVDLTGGGGVSAPSRRA